MNHSWPWFAYSIFWEKISWSLFLLWIHSGCLLAPNLLLEFVLFISDFYAKWQSFLSWCWPKISLDVSWKTLRVESDRKYDSFLGRNLYIEMNIHVLKVSSHDQRKFLSSLLRVMQTRYLLVALMRNLFYWQTLNNLLIEIIKF